MRMNRIRTLAIVAALTLSLAALAGCSGKKGAPAPGSFSGDMAKGKEIFAGTCAACHGPTAKGVTGLGKDLTVPSGWMNQQTDEMLLAFLKVGRPSSDPENTTKVDMPPKGGNPALSENDLKDVIVYVRSLQKK